MVSPAMHKLVICVCACVCECVCVCACACACACVCVLVCAVSLFHFQARVERVGLLCIHCHFVLFTVRVTCDAESFSMRVCLLTPDPYDKDNTWAYTQGKLIEKALTLS